jgi:hypothetical protein
LTRGDPALLLDGAIRKSLGEAMQEGIDSLQRPSQKPFRGNGLSSSDRAS